jgi:hypothetical protein
MKQVSFVLRRMWTTKPQFWMISAGIALSAGLAAAAQPRFTSFDYPGAAVTSPEGINAAGDVVGFYVDSKNVQHGFLLRAGTFSTIDYPGAIATHVNSINANGDMVGFHVDTAGLPGGGDRGFVLKLDDSVLTFGINPQFGVSGSFSFESVDFPGATATRAFGINSHGTVVGSYTDAAGKTHGYLLTRPQDADE